jgi:hypothetical protein
MDYFIHTVNLWIHLLLECDSHTVFFTVHLLIWIVLIRPSCIWSVLFTGSWHTKWWSWNLVDSTCLQLVEKSTRPPAVLKFDCWIIYAAQMNFDCWWRCLWYMGINVRLTNLQLHILKGVIYQVIVSFVFCTNPVHILKSLSIMLSFILPCLLHAFFHEVSAANFCLISFFLFILCGQLIASIFIQ